MKEPHIVSPVILSIYSYYSKKRNEVINIVQQKNIAAGNHYISSNHYGSRYCDGSRLYTGIGVTERGLPFRGGPLSVCMVTLKFTYKRKGD